MAIFNIFKTPKIRQYEHKNIYYSPEKEEREERLRKVHQELANEKENYQPTIRKGYLHDQAKVKVANNKSRNIQLIITIMVIVALLYWLI